MNQFLDDLDVRSELIRERERHAALVAALKHLEDEMRQQVRLNAKGLGRRFGTDDWADRLAAELAKVEQS